MSIALQYVQYVDLVIVNVAAKYDLLFHLRSAINYKRIPDLVITTLLVLFLEWHHQSKPLLTKHFWALV